MKAMSFRSYKHYVSDMIGIILEQRKNNTITMDKVKNASIRHYGPYEALPQEGRVFLEKIINDENLEEVYKTVKKEERIIRLS